MQVEPQITFLHTEPSPALEERIRAGISELEAVYDRITSCRVVVEAPAAGEHHGQVFKVRIFAAVPGSEIVVDHSPDAHGAARQQMKNEVEKGDESGQEHRDVYVAVGDAFEAARRQLERYAESRREIAGDRSDVSAAGPELG